MHRLKSAGVRALTRLYDRPALRARLGNVKIRHIAPFLRYNSPRKMTNLMRMEAQKLRRREEVSAYPYVMYLDPSNICNLKCQLCPTGRGDPLPHGAQRRLDLPGFTKVMEEFAPYLFLVHLYLWGEPLLNKNIVDFVRYAESKRVGTNISSNLNLLADGLADELVQAGLGHLVVSISGSRQETYERYHDNGHIEQVLKNVRKFADAKRRAGSITPFIEAQYILFDHNKHEVEEARRRILDAGADYMIVRTTWGETENLKQPATAVVREMTSAQSWKWEFKGACHQLYSTIVVHPDGGTGPCCIHQPDYPPYANLFEQDYADFRNNDVYKASRRIFRDIHIDPDAPRQVLCSRCVLAKDFVRARNKGTR